ncbi:hypothetical protein [Pseudomonas sp. CGJS7]|uniref:hypothetical protein n=1 Tax=Pseudomonas sp. CGJS7 TaxID=3109348 RepID=UPI003008A971
MNHNPYRAPSAAAPGAAQSRRGVYFAVLSGLQWAALLGTTSMLEMFRQGFIPFLLVAAFWLASLNLAIGAALLLWRRPVVAAFWFTVSALSMSAVLIEWRPLLSVTGFGIALIGLLLSLKEIRRKPSA